MGRRKSFGELLVTYVRREAVKSGIPLETECKREAEGEEEPLGGISIDVANAKTPLVCSADICGIPYGALDVTVAYGPRASKVRSRDYFTTLGLLCGEVSGLRSAMGHLLGQGYEPSGVKFEGEVFPFLEIYYRIPPGPFKRQAHSFWSIASAYFDAVIQPSPQM